MQSFDDKSAATSFPTNNAPPTINNENYEVEKRIYGNYQNYDMKIRSTMDEEAIEDSMGEQEPAAADAPYEEDAYNKEESFGRVPTNMRQAAMNMTNKGFAGDPWTIVGSHSYMGEK